MLGLGVRAVAAGCGGNKVGECVAAAVAGVAGGKGNTAGVNNHLDLLGSGVSGAAARGVGSVGADCGSLAPVLGGDASGCEGVKASVVIAGGVNNVGN